MRSLLVVVSLFAICGFSAHPPDRLGTLEIVIEPRFSGRALVLGNQLYRSSTGDSLYMDACRFYLCSVQLKGKNGVFAEKESYHLVDAEEPASQIIVLKNVPAGRYQSLCFQVGTDSLTNIAGAMGGDLDPTRGMYWAWNTGYINVKMEGRSNSCPTRQHAFEFHIGGYMPPHQTVRNIELPLKNAVVRNNRTTIVRINADLSQFFSRVSLTQTHSVMIPSRTAVQLADYFKAVFSVHP